MDTLVTEAPVFAGEVAGELAGEAAAEDDTHEGPRPARETMEYVFGPFRFIPARRTLLCAGVPQRLGGRAFDILTVLLERASEPVSKRELIGRVWPTTVVEDGNLKVHVAALRRTLGDFEQGSNHIATINGRGYCFVAPVQAIAMRATTPAATGALVDLLRQRLVGFISLENGADAALGDPRAQSRTAPGGAKLYFADLGALIEEQLCAAPWRTPSA